MEDMIPTVGFNMRKVTKGNVTMKLWDIGGQPRFRSMWERYCRGVNAIVYAPARRARPTCATRQLIVCDALHAAARARPRFVVDSADLDKMEGAKTELKNLLEKPQLAGIPILVLGNKNDLPGALSVEQIIDRLYGRPRTLARARTACRRGPDHRIAFVPTVWRGQTAPGTSSRSRTARCAATPSRRRTRSTLTSRSNG